MEQSNYKTGAVKLTVCCPLAKEFRYGSRSDNPNEW